MKDRLFLLDGMALAYRAHFAFIARPLINTKGVDTSAAFGFTGALLSLIEREKPEHIAVVFDAPEPTFRDELYAQYKGHRPPMPDPLRAALPYLKDIVRGFDIPMLEISGVEADDVIGTLARRAEQEDVHAIIVSPDKDFRQLLSPNVSIMRPNRKGEGFDPITEATFREEYGVDPIQFIDILALLGDAADNVPGVPGIGEKSAPSLIQQYGSVENLLDKAAEISAKRIREGLLNNREKAEMSKKLVTIVTDVPLDLDWHTLIRTAPKVEELVEIFKELEFKSYQSRVRQMKAEMDFSPSSDVAGQGDLFSGFTPKSELTAILESPETSFDEEAVSYKALVSKEAIQAHIQQLQAEKSIAFDTETTALDPMMASLVGCSMATTQGEAIFIPTPAPDGSSTNEILDDLRALLTDPNIEKVGQNIKYDWIVMNQHGVGMQGKVFDTMVAHYLLSPESAHNLDAMSLNLLNYTKIPTKELIGEGKKQISMREVPLAKITNYACEDADITLQLSHILRRKLQEEGLAQIADEMEFPLIPVLADMEQIGIRIDSAALKEFSRQLADKLLELEQQIYNASGANFNIGSPKQLGEILFERLKLPKGKKTATGQYSTNEQVLSELATEHSIAALLLDWRKLSKLKSTYVDALPAIVHPETQRIHTTFNQTIAATGRLSSTNPNLQNIPIRSEDGREIRRAFVPKDGFLLLSADYAQIELRIIASMSQDEGLIEAFRTGQDIHTAAAAKVFGVSLDEVTRVQRSKAKEVNYGIPYGISAFGLAQRMRVPRSEAQTLISEYQKAYPKVAHLIDELIGAAKAKGFAETLKGRRRFIPDINAQNHQLRTAAERIAVNMPIQGTQADMIKLAMVNIHRRLKEEGLKSQMVLQVHDELLFEVSPDEIEMMKSLVAEEMKNALPLSVPIEVGIGIGENWLDAH
jgi:DNA polymerase-1